MRRVPPDPVAALRVLSRHGVEFIVVGNVAGVLHGAPVTTFDIDIVHRRDDANVRRLMAALAELRAGYRDLTDRHLPPKPDLLMTAGHNLFRTAAGDLDALGSVGPALSFDDLLPRSVTFHLTDGFEVRCVSLEQLIELKESAGRPKDLAVLPVLRRTLQMRRDGGLID